MIRITTASRAVDLFGAGKDGFKNGNPGTGDPATSLEAAWFNMAQEELARIVEAAGIALDGAKYDQVLTALRAFGVQQGFVNFNADAAVADNQWGMQFIYTGAGGHTLSWDNNGKAGLNFKVYNGGTGNLTLDPAGAESIDGAASITLAPGQWINVWRYSDAAAIVAGARGYGISPYDIPFMAGWGSGFAGEDLVVQTYGVIIVPRAIKITGMRGYLGTAATGAACIVDVKKNGASIFTALPQFAISANALTAGTLDAAAINCSADDRLDFLVTQIGSTVKGQKLRFALVAETR